MAVPPIILGTLLAAILGRKAGDRYPQKVARLAYGE